MEVKSITLSAPLDSFLSVVAANKVMEFLLILNHENALSILQAETFVSLLR
jgi:hypothetical protein